LDIRENFLTGDCRQKELFVDRVMRRILPLSLMVLLSASIMLVGQQVPSDASPAQAAGKWNFYCHDPNGTTSTKSVEIEQKGSQVSGHFKGPNQSGGIEGSINAQHIVFKTKTREVLTFRGRIDGERVGGVVQGNKITGTFHAPRGTGTFEAVPAGN
jgi:hypothetical protein